MCEAIGFFTTLVYAVGFFIFLAITTALIAKTNKKEWMLLVCWCISVYIFAILTAVRFDTAPYEQAEISKQMLSKFMSHGYTRIEALEKKMKIVIRELDITKEELKEQGINY